MIEIITPVDTYIWAGIRHTEHGRELIKYLAQRYKAIQVDLNTHDANDVGGTGRLQGKIEILAEILADLDVEIVEEELQYEEAV